MGVRGDVGAGLDVSRWSVRAPWIFPLLLVAAGVGAYLGSFDGGFVLDDRRYIADNPRIRQLRPLDVVLSGRRPVVDLSLALNYAYGELELEGYHAVNLLVHLMAALALYGVVRRTLLREPRALTGADSRGLKPADQRKFQPVPGQPAAYFATWIAWATALIWVVHPLQTQSVSYLIQRCESMMGLFYLLTLYCVIRGAGLTDWKLGPMQEVGPTNQLGSTQESEPGYATWWYVAAVICCALGMGSKGVMVTAPVMVLLYDRVFISKSLGRALRRRWALYAGLAGTWTVLWACGVVGGILDPSRAAATTGFSFKGITPGDYALTQPGVILHYLSLSLWPYPLCLDYAWPVARTVGAILWPATAVAALLIGAAWALKFRPWVGFLGAWFFLILAPTSSFVPIRDPLFEHRMYLPLAAVVVLVVVGGRWALCRLSDRLALRASLLKSITVLVLLTAAASLTLATTRRHQVYQSPVSMWRDVVTKRPLNDRAHYNLGTELLHEDRLEEAIPVLRQALRLNPRLDKAHYNFGKALHRQGNVDEAALRYSEALQINPQLAEAHSDLGNILAGDKRMDEAIAHYRLAIMSNPGYVRAHYNLGSVLLELGKTEEAVQALRQAVDLSPETARIRYALGNALRKQRKINESISEYRATLQLDPDHIPAQQALAAALLEQGRPAQP